MTDILVPTPATDAAGFLPGPLGLRLDEEFMPLTALNAAPGVLDKIMPFGRFQQDGTSLLLRFWPDTIWASGHLPNGGFRSTKIDHGLTHFRLRGVEALHLLDFYTHANLFGLEVRQNKAIRTQLNHYDCVIWWTNTRNVHLLIDRSFAQSFADHLKALVQKHDPADPSTFPCPVAPDAPDRRG